MSLAQHVSSIEGVDRLPPATDAELEGSKQVRRVLSYDAFPPPQRQEQTHHLHAYKISTTKRAGNNSVPNHHHNENLFPVTRVNLSLGLRHSYSCISLTYCSSSCCHRISLLAGFRNRLRFRRSQTCVDLRRCLSRFMYRSRNPA
jgi:hypothetical protein